MDIEVVKKNFDYFRREKGLKIEEICSKMGGITRQALYNYMKTGATIATLEKIAAALGVQSWELLKPQPEKPGIFCPHCGMFIEIYFGKPQEHRHELGQNTPAQEEIKTTLF